MKDKENKVFKRADLIIYAILFIIAACLFLQSFKIKSDDVKTNGFSVAVKGTVVMTGDFTTKTYVIKDETSVTVVEDGVFEIVSESGKNVIRISWDDGDVKVTDTDCGTTKECTRMSLKNGDIICVPHSLIIRKIGLVADPTVG